MLSESAELRIVHVDDDAAFASLTADQLSRLDDRFVIETVESPDAAISVLNSEAIDCIISDYDMPSTDGLSFLDEVRANFGDIPFILFTGEGSESVASEAIARGVTDYLRKGGGTERFEMLANRVRTAISRRRAELNYQEIFEKATDGIVVHDPTTGEILDVNKRFAEMLGYDRTAVLDLRLGDIMVDEPPFTADLARQRVQQAHAGTPQSFEWRGETQAGETIPVEVNLKAAVIGGQDRVLAFVRDISERKSHERALTGLHETATELMAAESPSAVYETVVETAEAVFDCEYAIADEVVDGHLLPRAESPGNVGEDTEPVPIDGELNVASRAVEQGDPILIDDIHGPDGAPTHSPYRSVLSVPIGDHGVFQVASREVAVFDERDRELAELLISHATAALDRLDTVVEQRREAERLGGLFRNLPSSTVEYEMVDDEPIVQAVNPAFEQTFGYDEETVVNQRLDEFVVPPEHIDEARRLNEEVAAGNRLDQEVVRSTSSGSQTFRLVNAPIDSANGRQRGFAIYRDVTEREEARQRLAAIVEHAEQAIYLKDSEGRYELVNGACAALFDRSVESMEGRTDYDLFPKEEADRIRGTDEEVMANQEATTYERTIEIGGQIRVMRNQKYPYINAAGEVAGVVGISTDVTERRARERRLDALTKAFPDIALIVDENGKHVEVLASPSSEDLLYMDPEKLVGKRLDELFEPELAQRFQALVERTLETEELQTLEYQLDVQMGERWFEARTTPLSTTIDGYRAVAWVARDITTRRRRETELQRQRDRLDEFASVVSHDLRNPLSVAAGNLELAQEDCDSDHLAAVADAHDRMEALVDTLLDMAKGEVEPLDRERIPLREFARECWNAVETNTSQLEVDTQRDVWADPTRLRQLLENLYLNSIAHGGDDVTVRVGELSDGFFIEDTGPGIPAAERDRIFESGYSSEDDGIGYGLSIVSQVVEDHEWRLTLTDADEGGARFEIHDVQDPV